MPNVDEDEEEHSHLYFAGYYKMVQPLWKEYGSS